MDLYRLSADSDLTLLGFPDILDQGGWMEMGGFRFYFLYCSPSPLFTIYLSQLFV